MDATIRRNKKNDSVVRRNCTSDVCQIPSHSIKSYRISVAMALTRIIRPSIYVERLSNPAEAPESNGRIFGIIFAVRFRWRFRRLFCSCFSMINSWSKQPGDGVTVNNLIQDFFWINNFPYFGYKWVKCEWWKCYHKHHRLSLNDWKIKYL